MNFAVIGANWGDEGKGLMVDYLVDRYKIPLVVRFNGGAQVGHTVVLPDGRRHVFSHMGAGSFAGAATYLSRYFVCNPVLFWQERFTWNHPVIYVDPWCAVTTPYDMLINQGIERARGALRHGSCGVGFNETIERMRSFPLWVRDLDRPGMLESALNAVKYEWVPYRVCQLGGSPDLVEEIQNFQGDDRFLREARAFKKETLMSEFDRFAGQDIVFEGAQGLALDKNAADFPHVTNSNTGMINVSLLAESRDICAIYVTRTYATRHGAGPLPGAVLSFPDDTNIEHPFQGALRCAELDVSAMQQRILKDAVGVPSLLAVTHCDQLAPSEALRSWASFLSHGPTRDHVRDLREKTPGLEAKKSDFVQELA